MLVLVDYCHKVILFFFLLLLSMSHIVHQELTGQSLSEFKQLIATSLSQSDQQFRILQYNKTTKPSSLPLWKRFGPVCVSENNKPVVFIQCVGDDTSATSTTAQRKSTFVACHECETLYVYSSQTGTSALNKHKCRVLDIAPGGSHSMINFAKATVQPNGGQKQLISRSLGDMCALDIRPFSIVSGKGFRSLLQNVLDIGVSSKNPMRVEDLLPDQVTVKRSLTTRCALTRDILKSIIQSHFKCGLWAAFTLDIWTDDNHQQSFLSVTIHFIDDLWCLHDRTLQVNAFPNVSHTGAAILNEFNLVVEPYRSFETSGVTGKASDEQLIVVTDSASNNHSGDGLPSQYVWVPCSDHKIGTVINTVLAKKTMTIDGKKSAPFYEFQDRASEVFEMITHCKELVAYCKKSGLNSMLAPKLKQEIATRWYGLLTMLDSIRIQFQECRKLLLQKGARREKKIDVVDFQLLVEIVRLLSLFKSATLALECFKTPTIHLVPFWRNRLLQHCEAVTVAIEIKDSNGNVTETIQPDSEDVVSIKVLLQNQIKSKWSICRHHVIAAMLDPRQKSRLHLLGVRKSDIEEAKAELMRLTKIFAAFIKDPAEKEKFSTSSLQRPSRPLKRPKLAIRTSSTATTLASSSDEDEDEDHSPPQIDTTLRASRELSEYFALKLGKAVKVDLESAPGRLLAWWSTNSESFPSLALVARSILCIPASSSKSECNFSDAGNTLTAKRNGLKPSTLDILLFMRSNLDL